MASAVIGALRVNLGIDTAAFTDGIKKAQSSLDKIGKNFQRWGGKLSTWVTAPISAAGAGVVAAVTQMASGIDELRRSAQVAGADFEEFQKLAFAAKSVGFEGEKLADIYKDVNDKLGDFAATGGGAMKDFFDNIAPKVGITAEAFKNLSGPQALQLYYDSLVKAGASQADMTFYMEAIASDATALIPLLQNGGKAFRELGEGATVLSDQDAAGLKAYNDSMRALGEAVKSVAIALANTGIIDTITQIVLKVTDWIKVLADTNPELLKWGTIIAGVAAALGPALVAVGLFVTGIATIGVPVAAAIAGIGLLTAAVIKFWPEIKAAGVAISEFVTGAWAKFETAWDGMTAKVGEVKQKIADFAASIPGIFTNLAAQMVEIGSQIIQGLWDGLKSKMAAVKDSLTGFTAGVVDTVKSKLGIHSPSKVMREVGVNIMQGLSDGMGSQAGNVAGGATSIADDIAGAFSNIGSSIGEAINGTKKWSDVLKDVLRQLSQVVLSKLNLGGGSAGGGGFGGFLSSLFGSLLGFAQGGSIMPGGAGGIDSQVVAFRKSPSERVDIYDPGKGGGARGDQLEVTFRGVFADDNGVIRAQVTEMGKQAAQAGAQLGVRQVRSQMPGLMANAQTRSL